MANKRVTLDEVITFLEAGGDIDDVEITLFPPEDGYITEEESGDEDENNMNRLPGSVLRSEVEVNYNTRCEDTQGNKSIDCMTDSNGHLVFDQIPEPMIDDFESNNKESKNIEECVSSDPDPGWVPADINEPFTSRGLRNDCDGRVIIDKGPEPMIDDFELSDPNESSNIEESVSVDPDPEWIPEDINELSTSRGLKTDCDGQVIIDKVPKPMADDFELSELNESNNIEESVRVDPDPEWIQADINEPSTSRGLRKRSVRQNITKPSTKKVKKKSPNKSSRGGKVSKKSQKKSKEKNVGTWTNDELFFTHRAGRGDTHELREGYISSEITATQCFEKMFSPEIVQLLVEESNRYALYGNHTLDVTSDEIRVFISIIMLTGYLTPKYMRMFWEVQSDTYNKMVAESMRRNRFFEIQKYLHLSDNNNLPSNDKFAKVREYLSLLNKNFLENFRVTHSSHLSVDETMVPYYGKHGSKQHIKGKPIRFGYKLWSLCTRDGYLISFETYQGAKSAPLPQQNEIGLGAAVVLELSLRLPESGKPYNLYMDNFFTGLPLIRMLTSLDFGATGTIKDNRIEACPVTSSADMKKTDRGTYSAKFREDMCVIRWNDNSIVTVTSNCHSSTPTTRVDRIGFVEKSKKRITIPCPNIVQAYNRFMGGVDRFDENIASLRCSLKGRKWWYPIFIFGIDAACQNAWQLKKRTSVDEQTTYCEFRRGVVQTYCYDLGKKPTKPRSVSSVPKIRGLPNQPNQNLHEKVACGQRRCKNCHKNTRFMCQKCGVGLHIHCWYEFHSKK